MSPTQHKPNPATAGTASNAGLAMSAKARFFRLLSSEYFILYVTIAYVIVLASFIPSLLSPQNIVNILSNTWPLLIVAIGQTFVLAIAGIDLSQGAVIGFTSVIGAMLIATGANPVILDQAPIWGVVLTEQGGLFHGMALAVPLGIVAMLAAAAIIGLLNGYAVAVIGMPAFMTTLVTMLIIGALAIYLPLSYNIEKLPEAYIALGKGDVVSVYFGAKDTSQIARREIYSFITYPMAIAISVAVSAHILLNRTVFGRQVLAVGANRRAAEISGVPVRKIIITVFVISACCAAIASVLYSARLGAGRPTLGAGTFLLDIIGAAVIGGTSLFGGKAKIKWTFFGVLFFVILSNSLSFMNLTAFQVDMVKGGVIALAAYLDVIRSSFLREHDA
ncbi:MAG: ABC transporter permease [Phyllobacteriaceae bacterium]|nr:ABC transporter permease [Phyllobacteriaceae bacterium]